MDDEGNWELDPTDMVGRYAPSCASRMAEGFYSGALLGAVWGAVANGSSTVVLPLGRQTSASLSRQGKTELTKGRSLHGELHAFGRGVRTYAMASASTAGVFGVFVAVVHAGTCVSETTRRRKDWMNSTVGGLSAGAAVAMLSKHTRQPRQVAAHAVGAAVITSIVALVSGSTGLGGDII